MSDIASSRDHIEKRAKRFFAPDSVRMRELHEHIFIPLSRSGDVYVIGGALRDLAFFGADRRPTSDIDLVIAGPANQVEDIALSLNAAVNRFGGYGVKTSAMKVDFWSLEKTWAKTQKHAEITRAEHLLKSTFFDWDAILYDVMRKKIIANPNYLDLMHKRVMDINLLANPSPHGNLVRALRRLVMYDLRAGRRLRWFIDSGLRRYDWHSIVSAEREAYHTSFLEQFSGSKDFKHRFFIWRELSISGVHDRRQLHLDLSR